MPLSKLRPAGRVAIAAEERRKRSKDYEDYRAESGRDPFAEDLESLVPINAATETAKEQGSLAGLASWAGGGPPGQGAMSVVTNATHPAARFLAKYYPELMLNLERRPQIIDFNNLPEYLGSGVGSGRVNMPTNARLGPDEAGVDLSKLQTAGNRAANQVPARVELSKATAIAPDTDPEKHITTLHEVLHMLYGTNPNRAHVLPPYNRSFDMLYGSNRPRLDVEAPMASGALRPADAKTRYSEGALKRGGYEGQNVEDLLSHYDQGTRGGYPHAVIEALASSIFRNKLKEPPTMSVSEMNRRALSQRDKDVPKRLGY